jgi:thiol:disulfide interchange protein
VVFTLLGLYLLGKIRFRNDSPLEYVSVKRLVLAIISFAFVVYMIPGMWGAPLKALSGYMPPMETQDFVLGAESSGVSQLSASGAEAVPEGMITIAHGLHAYDNLDDAVAAASRSGKRIFVDITGHGCVNCREMESRVWSDPEVLRTLKEDFVIVALYVDDKTKLPESKWISNDSGKLLKDVGRVNSWIALKRFGVNSQPNYFILSSDGSTLKGPRAYNLDIAGYLDFLSE